MTTPTTEHGVEQHVEQDPPEQTFGGLLTAVALNDLIMGASIARNARLREKVGQQFVARYKDAQDGAVKAAVTVPGIGKVCDATLAVPQPVATVTDQAAFTDHVAEHHGTEIERVLTVKVTAGFGADQLLTALAEFLAPYVENGVAEVAEKRQVRPAFEKAYLKKNLDKRKLIVEVPDPSTAALIPVPGVTVTQPEPSGTFTLTGFSGPAKDRVREQLGARIVDAVRAALGEHEAAAALEVGQTVQGAVLAESDSTPGTS